VPLADIESFDYTPVVDALIGVTTDLGYIMIEDDSEGDLPSYPFATYNFISPYLPTGSQIEMNTQFEAVVSITFHDRSKLSVLNLSHKLATYLKTSKVRETLSVKDIVIVNIEAAQPRDNFISIAYERMAGFDVRLRLRDAYSDDVDNIEGFKINNNGG
jgi:hypothetical protein